MKITKGIQARAVKVLVYGTEGIGKSTFASRFPEPLFLDLEGGTHYLDVSRTDSISSWTELLETVAEVVAQHVCKTLVIDTADWAERLAIRHVCDKYQKSGIEEFGYGAGYTYLTEEFAKFLKYLDRAIAHGINVVILAHANLRTITLPEEAGSYDHWELKLSSKTTNKVAPMVKEWADMVLFANYKTLLVDDKSSMGAKKKAVGGQRVMYTTHTTFADAKNRFGLAPELPFDYKEIASVVFDMGVPDLPETLEDEPEESKKEKPKKTRAKKAETKAEPEQTVPESKLDPFRNQVRFLMNRDGVTEDILQKAIAEKGYFPADMTLEQYPDDFVENVLIAAWDQILTYINENINVPF